MIDSLKRPLVVNASLVLILAAFPASAPAQAPSGWIQDGAWLLLGPLGNPNGCGPGAAALENWIAPLDIASIAPGANEPAAIDFGAAASSGWQGVGDDPVWLSLEEQAISGNDLVDLLAISTTLSASSGEAIPGENVMAVLVTYVTYFGAEPILLSLCDASDDSIQVWVNNERVQNVNACRGTDPFCSERAPVVLVPGINAIKVLVWQGLQGWGFRVRLAIPDGPAITDAHPDFEFGHEGDGAVGLTSGLITRQVAEPFPSCTDPGDVLVTLKGDGGGGGSVTLVESVTGLFELVDISNGGVYSAPSPPEKSPVGIFEDSRSIGGGCLDGASILNPDGSYTVTGSGVDIWTGGDEFEFAYKEVTGDFELTAHVSDRVWAPGTRWGKVGLMARQDAGRYSRYSMVQTHGEDLQDADRFAGRRTHGGADNFETAPLLAGEHHDWQRLSRSGDVFTGEMSDDGNNWVPIGTQDWGASAPKTVLLGLAVCAHSEGQGGCVPAAITFDEVDLVGGADPKDPPGPAVGGTITWSLTRDAANAGVSYKLRGNGIATFTGHDAEHSTLGPGTAVVRSGAPSPGIFTVAHDIGTPCVLGLSLHNAGDDSYTITGSGNDIWQTGDQFQYAYTRFTGDFSMVAHVRERTWASGSRWGKVGIMARQDCTDRSRYSMLQTHGADLQDADRFAGRPTHGGNDNFESTNLAGGQHRDWMRLDRVGNLFVGSFSQDGVTWGQVGSMNWGPGAPATVLLGLAVNAHSDTAGGCIPATIVFDQVSIIVPSFSVSRSVGPADACPVESGTAKVVLTGTGDDGPAIPIVETVLGNVQVTQISNLGRFQKILEPSPLLPVGIFEDARDIGEPCTAGSTMLEGQSYTVTGGGLDIWQTGDQFQFAYRRATGDFSMVTHVENRIWAPGSRWGKVGIMARENHGARARYAMIQTHGEDPQDADRFAGRRTTNGSDNFEQTALLAGEHRDWMRLDRVDNVFSGFLSIDGADWQLMGSMNWGDDAPRTVLLGLAVCPHSETAGGCPQASITFGDIEITGGDGPQDPLTPQGGTISWSGSRSLLEGVGLSYRITGLGLVGLTGRAGDLPIGGPGTTLLTKVKTADIGEFTAAHDIGGPCVPGDTVHDPADGSYTITGGGIDIWQGGDQFQYAYKRVPGDFSMLAHVSERTWAPGSRWGKVGIMARQDCSDRSRYSMIQTHGEDLQDADRFAARPTHAGVNNFELTALLGGEHRDWLRLDRVGNVFTGYLSADGRAWEEMGGLDWGDGTPGEVLLGLGVCAHSDTQSGCEPATIVFDKVKITDVFVEEKDFFHRGDADANGQLQLTDAVRILNVLFLGTGTIGCMDAADADDNGQLQLTDAVRILNVLFLGTGTIPAPGPTNQPCGIDPTDDGLDCAAYPAGCG